MAKDDDLDLGDDDFDLDDLEKEFGGDDIEGIIEPDLDSRDPSTGFTSGAISGFAETFTDDPTELVKKLAANAIPDTLSSETDVVTDTYDTIKDTLQHEGHRLRKDAKKTIRGFQKLLPENNMVSNVLGSIADFVGPEDEESSYSASGPTTQERINSELTSLLGAQQEQGDVKAEIYRQIDTERANTDRDLQVVQASNIERMRKFMLEATAPYYTASLTVNLKQLFSLEELVTVTKSGFDVFITALNTIAKNTGLPDANKTNSSELVKRIMSEKVIGGVGSGLFNNKGVIERATGNLNNLIKDYSEAARGGLEEVAGLSEGLQLDDEFGPSKSKMTGGVLGDLAQVSAGKALGKLIGDSDAGKDTISKIKDFFSDPGTWLKQHANQDGAFSGTADVVRRLAGVSKTNFKIEQDNPYEASYFDNRTKDSINKVIPELLSKIYSEVKTSRLIQVKTSVSNNKGTLGRLQVAAPDAHELTYDNKEGTLVTKKSYANKIHKYVNDHTVKNIAPMADSVIVEFLKDARVEFTNDDFKALRSGLVYATTTRGERSSQAFGNGVLKYLRTNHPELVAKYRGQLNRFTNKLRADPAYRSGVDGRVARLSNMNTQHENAARDLHSKGMTSAAIDAGYLERGASGELLGNRKASIKSIQQAVSTANIKMPDVKKETLKGALDNADGWRGKIKAVINHGARNLNTSLGDDPDAPKTDEEKAAAATDTARVNSVTDTTAAEVLKEQHPNIPGHSDGKFTKDGGVNEIAGIVHRSEYVIPKKDLKTLVQDVNDGNIESIKEAVGAIAANVAEESKTFNITKKAVKNYTEAEIVGSELITPKALPAPASSTHSIEPYRPAEYARVSNFRGKQYPDIQDLNVLETSNTTHPGTSLSVIPRGGKETITDKVSKLLSNIYSELKDRVSPGVINGFGTLNPLLKTGLAGVSDKFSKFSKTLVPELSKTLTAVKESISTSFNKLGFNKVIESIDKQTNVISKSAEYYKATANYLKGAAKDASALWGEQVINYADGGVTKVAGSMAKKTAKTAKKTVGTINTAIDNSDAASSIKDTVTTTAKRVSDTASDAINSSPTAIAAKDLINTKQQEVKKLLVTSGVTKLFNQGSKFVADALQNPTNVAPKVTSVMGVPTAIDATTSRYGTNVVANVAADMLAANNSAIDKHNVTFKLPSDRDPKRAALKAYASVSPPVTEPSTVSDPDVPLLSNASRVIGNLVNTVSNAVTNSAGSVTKRFKNSPRGSRKLHTGAPGVYNINEFNSGDTLSTIQNLSNSWLGNAEHTVTPATNTAPTAMQYIQTPVSNNNRYTTNLRVTTSRYGVTPDDVQVNPTSPPEGSIAQHPSSIMFNASIPGKTNYNPNKDMVSYDKKENSGYTKVTDHVTKFLKGNKFTGVATEKMSVAYNKAASYINNLAYTDDEKLHLEDLTYRAIYDNDTDAYKEMKSLVDSKHKFRNTINKLKDKVTNVSDSISGKSVLTKDAIANDKALSRATRETLLKVHNTIGKDIKTREVLVEKLGTAKLSKSDNAIYLDYYDKKIGKNSSVGSRSSAVVKNVVSSIHKSVFGSKTLDDTEYNSVEELKTAKVKEYTAGKETNEDGYIGKWDDLTKEEQDALRLSFFASDEYKLGAVSIFSTWVETYARLDPGSLGNKLGFMKSILLTGKDKLFTPIRKLRDALVKETLESLTGTGLKELTLDQEPFMRKEFFASDEYKAGLVTSFDDWLAAQGKRKNGSSIFSKIKKALNPRELFKKTRKLDRLVMGKLYGAVGKGVIKAPLNIAKGAFHTGRLGLGGLGAVAKGVGASVPLLRKPAGLLSAVLPDLAALSASKGLVSKGLSLGVNGLAKTVGFTGGLVTDAVTDTIGAIPGMGFVDGDRRPAAIVKAKRKYRDAKIAISGAPGTIKEEVNKLKDVVTTTAKKYSADANAHLTQYGDSIIKDGSRVPYKKRAHYKDTTLAIDNDRTIELSGNALRPEYILSGRTTTAGSVVPSDAPVGNTTNTTNTKNANVATNTKNANTDRIVDLTSHASRKYNHAETPGIVTSSVKHNPFITNATDSVNQAPGTVLQVYDTLTTRLIAASNRVAEIVSNKGVAPKEPLPRDITGKKTPGESIASVEKEQTGVLNKIYGIFHTKDLKEQEGTKVAEKEAKESAINERNLAKKEARKKKRKSFFKRLTSKALDDTGDPKKAKSKKGILKKVAMGLGVTGALLGIYGLLSSGAITTEGIKDTILGIKDGIVSTYDFIKKLYYATRGGIKYTQQLPDRISWNLQKLFSKIRIFGVDAPDPKEMDKMETALNVANGSYSTSKDLKVVDTKTSKTSNTSFINKLGESASNPIVASAMSNSSTGTGTNTIYTDPNTRPVFTFDEKSKALLYGTDDRPGVHEKLSRLCEVALSLSAVKFNIRSGYRTTLEQTKLYKAKRSKADGIEKLSDHQRGMAIDFYPEAVVNGKKLNPLNTESPMVKYMWAEAYKAFSRATEMLGLAVGYGYNYAMFGGRDWSHISLKGVTASAYATLPNDLPGVGGDTDTADGAGASESTTHNTSSALTQTAIVGAGAAATIWAGVKVKNGYNRTKRVLTHGASAAGKVYRGGKWVVDKVAGNTPKVNPAEPKAETPKNTRKRYSPSNKSDTQSPKETRKRFRRTKRSMDVKSKYGKHASGKDGLKDKLLKFIPKLTARIKRKLGSKVAIKILLKTLGRFVVPVLGLISLGAAAVTLIYYLVKKYSFESAASLALLDIDLFDDSDDTEDNSKTKPSDKLPDVKEPLAAVKDTPTGATSVTHGRNRHTSVPKSNITVNDVAVINPNVTSLDKHSTNITVKPNITVTPVIKIPDNKHIKATAEHLKQTVTLQSQMVNILGDISTKLNRTLVVDPSTPTVDSKQPADQYPTEAMPEAAINLRRRTTF